MAKLKCWCKKCGELLKTKREYIKQEDICDKCFTFPTLSKEN